MTMLISSLAALSSFYPASRNVEDPAIRALQIHRLLGKVTALAAMAFRHTKGLPYVMPDNDLSYVGNFMNMLYRMAEPRYAPSPVLERALDKLFILHADHEQNCSTNTMRIAFPSDPLRCGRGRRPRSTPAPRGPTKIRCCGDRPEGESPRFIRDVKERKALCGVRAPGVQNYDPRAKALSAG
jgi:citrate synthase